MMKRSGLLLARLCWLTQRLSRLKALCKVVGFHRQRPSLHNAKAFGNKWVRT